jgi:hypothetical protein
MPSVFGTVEETASSVCLLPNVMVRAMLYRLDHLLLEVEVRQCNFWHLCRASIGTIATLSRTAQSRHLMHPRADLLKESQCWAICSSAPAQSLCMLLSSVDQLKKNIWSAETVCGIHATSVQPWLRNLGP